MDISCVHPTSLLTGQRLFRVVLAPSFDAMDATKAHRWPSPDFVPVYVVGRKKDIGVSPLQFKMLLVVFALASVAYLTMSVFYPAPGGGARLFTFSQS
jgi:hypothetical protein